MIYLNDENKDIYCYSELTLTELLNKFYKEIKNNSCVTTDLYEKYKYLLERPITVDTDTGNVNLYSDDYIKFFVDCYVGDDENGLGTEDKPWRTIQKAFDNVPKILKKSVRIFCRKGDYDESPVLYACMGMAVYLYCWDRDNLTPLDEGVSCRVNGLTFRNCLCYVHIEDFGQRQADTDGKGFIVFVSCSYASVARCRFDKNFNDVDKPTLWYDGVIGSCNGCYFENQYICIYSINSMVRADESNYSLANNTYTLFCQQGIITKYGKEDIDWTWEGTVKGEREVHGGRIFEALEYSWRQMELENDWIENSGIGAKVRKDVGLGYLYMWVEKDTGVDTTIICTLPQHLRPINTIRTTIQYVGTSSEQPDLPILSIGKDGTVKLLTLGGKYTNAICACIPYPIK